MYIFVISFHCPDYFSLIDVKFGKTQARDMLQHLWAGPISKASVDVVRGNHSVEVHAMSETKVKPYCFSSHIMHSKNYDLHYTILEILSVLSSFSVM